MNHNLLVVAVVPVNELLNLVARPLRVEVHRPGEVHQREVRFAANLLLQLVHGDLVIFRRKVNRRPVKLDQRIVRIEGGGPVQQLQRTPLLPGRLLHVVADDGQVTHQYGIVGRYLQRPLVVAVRVRVLLLLVVDHADAVPGVVVPSIQSGRIPEAGHRIVQLVGGHQLVAEQCVGVAEGGVHLDGPLEELDANFVLLLQAEAVPGDAPRLRGGPVKVDQRLRQAAELHLLLLVPEGGAVDLHALEAVRLGGTGPLEGLNRLVVLAHLKVGAANGGEDVAERLVGVREMIGLLLRLGMPTTRPATAATFAALPTPPPPTSTEAIAALVAAGVPTAPRSWATKEDFSPKNLISSSAAICFGESKEVLELGLLLLLTLALELKGPVRVFSASAYFSRS
ncbi:hypothetical protein TYRP_007828 [Tyrophagus putrescentiae]|nr:hypothetical protein TYRP_007828 [Tyrophagus putrescentiae]